MGARILALALVTLLPAQSALADKSNISITYDKIPLNGDAPAQSRVGRLMYLGGLVLKSRDKRFGGYSALHVSPDGKALTAISDLGTRLTASIIYQDGKLAGLGNAHIAALTSIAGKPLKTIRERDAEGMVVHKDGTQLISFEREHRILAYRRGIAVNVATPRGLKQAPRNGGLEALVTLSDGRLLAIQEAPQPGEPDGTSRAWVRNTRNNMWERLTIARTGPFSPTDASLLPDGGIVLLERHYLPLIGIRIRISKIAKGELVAGRRAETQVLAQLAAPSNVDNMEGIAAIPTAGGKTRLYVISDDNFNAATQRTLLMMFEIAEAGN